MNFARLAYVAERAQVGQNREAIFAVTIPEQKGSFYEFILAIGELSITEFNYRLATRDEAHIFVGVEVSGAAEARQFQDRLEAGGYACTDLSSDEIAKSHVRHMVGGLAAAARDEVLYSFEFPERPGAFMQFLTSLSGKWNISLFHYRNHGSDVGRVLVGMQVPDGDTAAFADFLTRIGYRSWVESDHPAYRLFLG
jgi:threonine dehydratase